MTRTLTIRNADEVDSRKFNLLIESTDGQITNPWEGPSDIKFMEGSNYDSVHINQCTFSGCITFRYDCRKGDKHDLYMVIHGPEENETLSKLEGTWAKLKGSA